MKQKAIIDYVMPVYYLGKFQRYNYYELEIDFELETDDTITVLSIKCEKGLPTSICFDTICEQLQEWLNED